MIGETLSHFEIKGRLGAGGMGEVYRAADLKLGRDVALKVLPAELGSDPRRLARFRREARSLAALDHPGIVTVFSIEEDEEPPFLTMELVEGRTLDKVIPKAGLDTDSFFEIALPLVDAVATAHAGGVLHRDLKPSNVMVSNEGRVKILDFGLAKVGSETAVGQGDATTDLLTEEHQMVGTLVYMSPEQLQGRPADYRSDVFALGIVLYQLATGRSPFGGDSSMEVMSSILQATPPIATERKAALPPQLARILDRCLKKDPDDRLQSARDLHFALDDLRRALAAGDSVGSAGEVEKPQGTRSLGWPTAVALGLVAVVAAFWVGRRTVGDPAGERLEAPLAVPVVTWPSTETAARLSPDGEWLSFVSDRGGVEGLWIQRVDGGGARVVPGASGAVASHVWSVTGNEIAVLTRQEDGMRVEILPAPLGGRPRLSLVAPPVDRVVDWREDRLLLEGGGRLVSFDLETATAEEVSFPDSDFSHRRQFDTDAGGSGVVFTGVVTGRENLWHQELSGERLELLTDDEAIETFPHCLGAACEQVAYVSNRTGQTDIWILDRARGSSRQLRVPTAVERIEDAASDGSLMALRVVNEDANLWTHDAGTGRNQPLTADTLTDFGPSAGADSSLVAFQRSRPGVELASRFLDSQIYVAERDGAVLTDPRPVGGGGYGPLVSPGGKRVAFLRTSLAEGQPPFFTELWVIDVQSGRERLLSGRFQMSGFYELPATLMARNLSWRDAGTLVFVAASELAVPEIRRVDFEGDAVAADSVFALEERGLILDLRFDPDGALGFLTAGFGDQPRKLFVLRDGGAAASVYEGRGLRLAGASGPGSWILTRASVTSVEAGALEVLEVDERGAARSVGVIEQAVAATAVLGPRGRRLYLMVARDEATVLASFDLSSGELETVRAAELPGVVFTGIVPLPDGSLIYSEQRRNADLWLLRSSVPAAKESL